MPSRRQRAPRGTEAREKMDACPVWPRGRGQGWSRGLTASRPHVDAVCLLIAKSVACLVLRDAGVWREGRGWRGWCLYSESPVTFPPISWRSVKGRSLSGSKCLTQSKEGKNRAISGELHFPPSRALTRSHPIALSSSLCKSPKRVHFLITGPLDGHAPTACLCSNLGCCCPGLGQTVRQGRRCQRPRPQEAPPATSLVFLRTGVAEDRAPATCKPLKPEYCPSEFSHTGGFVCLFVFFSSNRHQPFLALAWGGVGEKVC